MASFSAEGPYGGRIDTRPDADLLPLLNRAADAVIAALSNWSAWGPSGRRVGQYASDLQADAAVLEVLGGASVGVLSEESGLRSGTRDITVVVDPLDGSTNASRRLSWWATSLCAVDEVGPAAAVVVDLVHGSRYEAERGGGASRDGAPIAPSGQTDLADSIVGVSGMPPRPLGWRQFRALGASALDLCAVADGRLDAWVDCSVDAHGVWDYLGALLVCREAGVPMVDALGRELVVLDHAARRTPVAAASNELLEALTKARANAFAA